MRSQARNRRNALRFGIPSDEDVIRLILLHEGGIYTNDPADAGGPTKWGITIPILAKHRGRKCTAEDIRNLSRDEASDIYRIQFVRPFDGLPDPLRVNVIDMGVNAGQARAIKLLQQTIGVTVDGKIGPQTKRKAIGFDWGPLYTGVRLAFYEDLIIAKPMNIKWRNGWRNRALSFYDGAIMLRRAFPRGNQPIFGHMGKAA